MKSKHSTEQLSFNLIKWVSSISLLSVITGSVIAFFLWLLDQVTMLRWQNNWLLFLLPFAGIAIHYIYKLWGKNAEAGNNLIIQEIHEPGGGIPIRMAPLVLATTIITHLFGGSAGREGTAVQIGGSIAGNLAHRFKLEQKDISILLMAGIAAGFGAVFGTPVTGAIFALEVLAIGWKRYRALLPCLFAAILADYICSAWGIHHTQYKVLFDGFSNFRSSPLSLNILLLVKVILAGALFGLASYCFVSMQRIIKKAANRFISIKFLIPFAGGIIIIALCYILQTRDYLGLGVVSDQPAGISITSAFSLNGVTNWSWFWKLLFTSITLGCGFKGGEVTPLFFIGAALGNTIASLTGAPIDLLAALGFIAVFAGATNTPVACMIMGVELFGPANMVYYAIATFTAYYFSGHNGIYEQRKNSSQSADPKLPGTDIQKPRRENGLKVFKLWRK